MVRASCIGYTFSHRSFQEYFAAYFLSRVKVDEFATILPKLIARASYDSVVGMAAEMNRERFEEAWALPTLTRLNERIRKIDAKQDCVAFDAALFEGWPKLAAFDMDPNDPDAKMLAFNRYDDSGAAKSEHIYAVNSRFVLYRIYGIFDAINRRLDEMNPPSDAKIIQEIASGKLLGSDARFASWRKKVASKEEGFHRYPEVLLTSNDHAWVCKTRWGLFLQLENESIPKLLQEVKHRVDERRKGLAAIFE
jgi:hypothetical protein